MDEQLFLQKITTAFQASLPGIDAHKLLTPRKRPLKREEIEDISAYRESSVAVVCFPVDEKIHTIIIQRPQYEGSHGGQISFPGGKMEPFDLNLEHTARRETKEEIGWELNDSHFLGELTELFIPVSLFSVHPFLYLCEEQPFIPDQREVAEIIHFPIEKLLESEIVKTIDIPYSNGMKLKDVPYFDIENKVVWGATAIILSELRELLK